MIKSKISHKKRRAVFWTIFTAAALSVAAILLIPSGSHSQPVPPSVTLEGISRPEAERLYGRHQWLLRHLIWNELRQLEFNQAWQRVQILRYSHVQSIRQDATNAATITVVYSIPGRPTSTYPETTYFRYGTKDPSAKPR